MSDDTMNGAEMNQVPGISFQDLFGSDNNEISMERVEAFLDKLIDVAAEQAHTNPNALVRIVHGDRVTWMTQEQAAHYLKESGESNTLRKDIEAALKGQLKNIRKELEILLAIAHYTLKKFKENESIPPDEIKRIEPGLQRREYEIKEGVSQTAESEALVEEKRRRNPVIEEFEELMGKFLQEKSRGNMEQAALVAKDLSLKKKQYVLVTRSIEPDVKTIYYHRLNLQKTKKRLLRTQNELCSTRKDALTFELNELRSSLNSIQQQTQEAEYEGQDQASEVIGKQDFYDSSEAHKEIDEKVTELESLQKESEVLDRQEASVDAVISTISEQVLGDTETKFNVKEQLQKESMKAKPKTNAPAAEPKEKLKSHGMHIHRNR